MNTGLLLLLAYVGLLLWALRKKQWQLEGPWWFHLRAFLPNWKFYHAVGWMPRLWVRHRLAPDTAPTAWALVYPRRARRLWHLIHNPDVNLALAEQNLVDHLANDISALPEDSAIDAQPIYQLVQRLAARHLLDQGCDPHGQLQWELRLTHPSRGQTEVILSTPWTALAPVLRTAQP